MIKLAATVTFYNPSKENVENINSYIDFVDKIYVVDNSSKKEKYVFKIKGDKYIFDAKQSAEVPKIKMTAKGKPQEVVPDGMVFTAVN